MTYDQYVRTYADEASEFRARRKDIINLLREGGGPRIKREVIREYGSTTFANRSTEFKRLMAQPTTGKETAKRSEGP